VLPLPWRQPLRRVPWPRSPLEIAATVTGGILVVALAAQQLRSAVEPLPTFDTIGGHLQLIAHWLQSGDLRSLPYLSPSAVAARYPANSELQGLWFVLPLHRDFLVQAASFLWLGLLASATALGARVLGARRLPALAAVLVVPTLPLVLGQIVGTNMSDLLLAGSVVAMLAFLAMALREPRPATFALAGMSAGLAAGARYAGLIALLAAAPVLVAALRRAGRGAWLRAGAVFLGGVVLCSAFWYVRNAVITGSPLYPQPLPGQTPSPESHLYQGFSSYLGLGIDPHAWRLLLSEALRLGGPLLPLLMLATLIPPAVAARQRRRDLAAWAWAVLPLAQLVGVLGEPLSAGFIYHGQPVAAGVDTNMRYLLPAVAASAMVLAGVASRLRPPLPDWAAVVAMGLGIAGLLDTADPGGPSLGFAAAAVVALVGLLALLLAVDGRRLALGVAAAAVVVLPGAGIALQHHYDSQRGLLPYAAAASHLPSPAGPVDVAGFCDTYAFDGPEFQHQVVYLSGSDSGITHPLATTYGQWLEELRAEGVDTVVISHDSCFGKQVPQSQWTAQHPESFRLVYSGRAAVYRVLPPPASAARG
jgi:4-amino-4-deoxy-L-arabinose transferase-like glycosyltransferase